MVQTTNTTSGRKRELNVIYFIDAARTRSFRVPLTRLAVILSSLVLLVGWAVLSGFIIYWGYTERALLSKALGKAQSTIFEYETRYDGAYEVAYPTSGGRGATSLAAVPKEVGPKRLLAERSAAAQTSSTAPYAPEASRSKDEESTGAASEAKPSVPSVSSLQDETLTTTAVPAAGTGASEHRSEIGIGIDSPVLEPRGDALELRFVIKNEISPTRVEGYVWAIARFKPDDGPAVFIGAPQGIEVGSDGKPSFPRRSNVFAIRNYKRKKFIFPYVKGQTGTFTGIKISVMDKDGDGKVVYDVPVQIRVGEVAASHRSGDLNGQGSASSIAISD